MSPVLVLNSPKAAISVFDIEQKTVTGVRLFINQLKFSKPEKLRFYSFVSSHADEKTRPYLPLKCLEKGINVLKSKKSCLILKISPILNKGTSRASCSNYLLGFHFEVLSPFSIFAIKKWLLKLPF